MTKQQAEFIKELLEYTYEVDIRENYSGRHMYGETTFAIVTNAKVLDLFIELANFAQDVPNFSRKLNVDNMGQSSIVIF